MIADALLRLPVDTKHDETSDAENTKIICAVRAHLRSITLNEPEKETSQDAALAKFVDSITISSTLR